uniref:AlNc14C283G10144 protein n=1 Tax=Albugo laibachii Nc14 TaxID=890382 RepID=F0WUZ7_9STRA|nr:AlNc14C283G10144 [Albugo laibachii Nc14]|eukprot:CCA25233.1 AlNc14C283G10144 [Albugo laibachii Nc14]
MVSLKLELLLTAVALDMGAKVDCASTSEMKLRGSDASPVRGMVDTMTNKLSISRESELEEYLQSSTRSSKKGLPDDETKCLRDQLNEEFTTKQNRRPEEEDSGKVNNLLEEFVDGMKQLAQDDDYVSMRIEYENNNGVPPKTRTPEESEI